MIACKNCEWYKQDIVMYQTKYTDTHRTAISIYDPGPFDLVSEGMRIIPEKPLLLNKEFIVSLFG